jgi:hypothetical protein
LAKHVGTYCTAAFFISIILGSAESDLYCSVGATFAQIINESAFIHPKQSDTILNLIAIERFHPIISTNILPNILSKLFLSLLSKKSLKKNDDVQ